MADPQTFEDQASHYVLGQLSEPELQVFERRLAESAELRALVAQLEEGLSALAMTAPRRQPPRDLWARIEKAVAQETRQKVSAPPFWVTWWRHGWAAAAACLVCFGIYVVWERADHRLSVAPVAGISDGTAQPGATNAHPQIAEIRSPSPRTPAENELVVHLLQTRTQEVTALSRQVADLTKRMADLSQDLSNKNVQLTDPSRLKFFQLSPVSSPPNETAAAAAPAAPISTNLQRALFFAMAREMGWLPETPKAGAGDGNNRPGGNHVSSSAITNLAGVDFVDLKPGNGESTSVPNVPSTTSTESTGTLTAPLTNAIPGFVSGTNAVLAFDPGVFPIGSSLTFFTVRSWGHYSSIGTAPLRSNPTVVTVPLDASTRQGGNVTVILSTSAGSYSVIGQFPASSASSGQ